MSQEVPNNVHEKTIRQRVDNIQSAQIFAFVPLTDAKMTLVAFETTEDKTT